MTDREKALALVNAYFDNENIEVKDPKGGILDWTSLKDPKIRWTFLSKFLEHLDCYKVTDGKS